MNKMNKNFIRQDSSFRDPSGYLFYREGILYRQINNVYKEHYEKLINSGLYNELTANNLLIPHEEVNVETPFPENTYKIIKPEKIPFISYPYEWSFSQLKDAALTTLEIQKKAMEYGMTLKDSSSYNIQFYHASPLIIDTLSFETYVEKSPWIAYKQFCQHFLAPLALMYYCDTRLSQLLKTHLDGVPLDLASSLLPFNSRLRFSVLTHIHMHAKGQKRFSNSDPGATKKEMSYFSLRALIDSLESTVKKLELKEGETTWSDYYHTETGENYLEHKKELVDNFLEEITKTPGMITWDIGANTGVFSRIAASKENYVISMDLDPACVEHNYAEIKAENIPNILPALVDFTNPSPPIGWENKERLSLLERGPADTALALALVHHLVIGNNLPLSRLAEFFYKICHNLIIEFVPKTDTQAQRLLASREDIFSEYTQELFEKEFKKYFKLKKQKPVSGSKRILYLMEVNNDF